MCQHCNLIGQQAGAEVASMGYAHKLRLDSEPVSCAQVAPLQGRMMSLSIFAQNLSPY